MLSLRNCRPHCRHIRSRILSGFTLPELMVVFMIIGILAGIVVPKFINEGMGTSNVNVRFQLHEIRTQLEVYKMRHHGQSPDLVNNQWNDLITGNMFSTPPRNPYQNSSSLVASGPAPGVGWVWDGVNIAAVGPDGEEIIE